MKELTVFSKSRGLNSAIDPKQAVWTENGFEVLSIAVNVDITDGYRISRRKGFALQSPGVAHSLYTWAGNGYCIFDGTLVRINQVMQRTVLRTGMTNDKVRYTGAGDKLFYSNGKTNGFIHGDTDYAWNPGLYYGPDTTHEYSAPPVCRHLSLHRGRIYLSKDSALWYTEPLQYLGVNLATDFIMFPSPIRMVKSVQSQLIVATDYDIFILGGSNPDEFTFDNALSERVIEDTAVVVQGPLMLGKQIPGSVCIFTTQNGIFAVLGDGSFTELTDNRLRLPEVNTGNAYIKDGMYTVLIDE